MFTPRSIAKRTIAITSALTFLVTLAVGTAASASDGPDAQTLVGVYDAETQKAGGQWFSYVTHASRGDVVNDEADQEVKAWSVNKLAVATAVLHKVDKGEISLGQKVILTDDIVAEGSGSYALQGVAGDELTVANVLTNMLQVSDNTAVRLLGTLVSGDEINSILIEKGFANTKVEPLPDNPQRFFLGTTTPRDNNKLLTQLGNGGLLSPASTDFMLKIMRWTYVGYTDGVRDQLNSAERDQTAVKYGVGDGTFNETGIVFDKENKPAFVYSFFNMEIPAEQPGQPNAALNAQSNIGRHMLDVVNS